MQILEFFRALGPSGTRGGPGPVAVPIRLKNCRICKLKSAEILQIISANLFKAVRHTLSGTVVKMLRVKILFLS